MQNDVHSSIGDAVDDAVTRTVAIAGLGGIALIHVLQLPEAFDETAYLGALFICAVVGSVVLAAVLTRINDPRVLEAAGGLAGLILLGYIISRAVGLPDATNDVGEWTEPLGLASMVAESLVVSVTAGVLATQRLATGGVAAPRAESPERQLPGTQHGPAPAG